MLNKLIKWIAKKRGLEVVDGVLIAKHKAKNATSFNQPMTIYDKDNGIVSIEAMDGMVITKGQVIRVYYCKD